MLHRWQSDRCETQKAPQPRKNRVVRNPSNNRHHRDNRLFGRILRVGSVVTGQLVYIQHCTEQEQELVCVGGTEADAFCLGTLCRRRDSDVQDPHRRETKGLPTKARRWGFSKHLHNSDPLFDILRVWKLLAMDL